MAIREVSLEDAEKADAVICIRVSDARFIAKGSQIHRCETCDHEVYVAPSSPIGPPLMCMQCFTVVLEKEGL